MYVLKESLDRMAKASSMRWYGHILRREEDNVLSKALQFELLCHRGSETIEAYVKKTSRK